MKNIDDLAFAKEAGVIQSNGVERIIKDVRLDIVTPKGYDKSVFNKVEKYAKDKGVKINIFESE